MGKRREHPVLRIGTVEFLETPDVSRAERNQAVWRSKSVPLGLRCSAKMSAYDGCRREPLVAARLVEPMRQGNRWLSAW